MLSLEGEALQAAPEQFHGPLGGDFLEGLAVEGMGELEGRGAAGEGDSDDHGANRFFRGAPARAGDAGDGKGAGGPGGVAGSLGHFPGHAFAHGPLPGEGGGRDLEECFFGRVAVGDVALEKDFGGPGDIGEAMGEVAAGAGLGQGEGLSLGAEEFNQHFFQGLALVGKEIGIEVMADDFLRLGEEGGRIGADGDEAEIDFAGAGAVTEFEALWEERLQRALDDLFEVRFPKAGGAEDAAEAG
jgi:hypothetical protein